MRKGLIISIFLMCAIVYSQNIFEQIRLLDTLPESTLRNSSVFHSKNRYNKTPLEYAVSHQKACISKQLIDAGAPLQEKNMLYLLEKTRDVAMVDFVLRTFPQIHNDSIRTRLFQKCGRYYSKKKSILFSHGVTLDNEDLYDFAYLSVGHNDTIALKAFVDKKVPLRIAYAGGKRNYSVINALRDKNNQKMLDYYKEKNVKLTPDEYYYHLITVVRSDDTVSLKKLLEENRGINNPDTAGEHILYWAGWRNSLHSFNYILNNFHCDSSALMDGVVGLWINTYDTPLKRKLLKQLWAMGPSIERLNEEPSPLSNFTDGKRIRPLISVYYKKGIGLNARGRVYGDTPLHEAASHYMDDGWLEQLLIWGADPSRENNFGQTPLFYAVRRKNISFIKKLIDAGCDVNHKSKKGYPALSEAFPRDTSGHFKPEVIEFLLKKGADLNFVDTSGTSFILKYMYGRSSKYLPLIAPYFKNDSAEYYGKTILHAAAKLGKSDSILSGLQYENMDINKVCNERLTPLHYAVRNAIISIEPLLVAGADPEIVEPLSWSTPLHYAVAAGNAEAVALLLEAGADVNAKTRHNKTAIAMAVENSSLEILLLLKKYGAEINDVDVLGNTLLMSATQHKRLYNVIALLHWGLDPTQRNNRGNSPYDLTEGGYLKNYPELRAILREEKPLPPIPDCSREQFMGQWWLSEESYYSFSKDTMVTDTFPQSDYGIITVTRRLFNGYPYNVIDGELVNDYGRKSDYHLEGGCLIHVDDQYGGRRKVYRKKKL